MPRAVLVLMRMSTDYLVLALLLESALASLLARAALKLYARFGSYNGSR